jgi:PAS domain S-box-containing protein
MAIRFLSRIVQRFNRWLNRRESRMAWPDAALEQAITTPMQHAYTRRAVIDALPASIALLDGDGVITLVNNAWERFAIDNELRSPDFCVGLNYLQVSLLDDQAFETVAGIRRVLSRTASAFSIEYPCHSATEERWFELIAFPLEDSLLSGAMVSHVNITRRKLAERSMLAGAVHLAEMQRTAQVGSWEFDLRTMRGTLSHEMSRLYYCSAASEIDFDDFITLVHPEDRREWSLAVIPASDEAPHVLLKYRTNPARGPERLISAVVYWQRDTDGRILRSNGIGKDITEQKHAEDTLRACEQRFATAFSQAPIGVAVAALDGRFLKVNYALCHLLGYSEADLLQMTFRDVTHSEDLTRNWSMVQSLIDGHLDNFRTETCYVRADGSIVTTMLSVVLVRDCHGQPESQIVNIQDRTDHKRIEQDLAEAIERLTEAQRIGQIGDWSYDIATRTMFWSPQILSIMGRDPQPGPANSDTENATFYDDDSQAFMADKIALAIATGTTQQYEFLARRTDAELIWLKIVAVPSRDNSGKVCKLRGTMQDISQHKHNEMLSARIATLIDSSEDAIITKDMSGHIISWNPSAERIFGYTATEMKGQSILRLIPVEQYAEEEFILCQLRDGRKVDYYESTRLTRYGKLIDVSLSVSPIRNEQGQIVGASKIVRDISERRQIDLKLQRDARRLQELSHRLMNSEEEERRRLGRDLHDQTGSNLTAFTLNLKTLRAKLPSTVAQEMKRHFDDLESLVRETILHIRDVLSNLRPPALDEFGVLAALTHFVERIAAHSDLQLKVYGHEPSPRLSPEIEIALFRIAQEALTNALKHANARCVTIVLNSDGSHVRLHVQDDGRGFDYDNNRPSLSSLGMITMRERAQAIGAELRLRSAIGTGTEITVVVENSNITKPTYNMRVGTQ